MSRVAVVACVLGIALMTACGGDDDGAEGAANALIGTWLLQVNDGTDCVFGLTFASDSLFEQGYACTLNSGEIGYEATVGGYEVKDTRIGFTPEQATCENTNTETGWVSFTYKNDRKQLQIVNESGVLVFERREDDGMGGGSGSAVFGCFTEDVFEARKLTAL